MFKFGLWLTALACAFAAHGEGTRGGGDDMGLEFQGLLDAALNEIQAGGGALQAQVVGLHLDTLYGPGGARALMTPDLQTVTVDGVTQDGVASSDTGSLLTLVNRARWKDIVSIHLRQGIALHEALVLKQIESTGQYPISGKYLAQFGLLAESLITGQPLPVTTKDHILTVECTPTKFWRVDAGDDVAKLYLVFDGSKGLQDPVVVITYHTGIGLPPMTSTLNAALDSDTPGKILYRMGEDVMDAHGVIEFGPASLAALSFDFKALKLGSVGHGVATDHVEARRGISVLRPAHNLNCKVTDQPPTG